MNKMTEMWAALEAHQPLPEYAGAWWTMLRERTEDAADAAADAAAWGETQAAWAAADAADAAQCAIDAIKEVQP
jgi:hypothetical protein